MSKASIFLANGLEEIEGLTVVDLLRRADICIQMVSIEEGLQVCGSHQIKIEADVLFSEADFSDQDMIILPGGMPGTKHLLGFEPLNQLIKEFHQKGKGLAAICAAPIVLGANNILVGKRAACYPGFEDQLIGATAVFEPVVSDGNIITSRGLGTAIEFALQIITYIKGKEKAEEVKKSIIYNP